jgi:hypothetical protein
MPERSVGEVVQKPAGIPGRAVHETLTFFGGTFVDMHVIGPVAMP